MKTIEELEGALAAAKEKANALWKARDEAENRERETLKPYTKAWLEQNKWAEALETTINTLKKLEE